MTDREKKMDEAVKRYCKETDCTQKEASLIEEGFKEGAHWSIKEFLKGLWHDASEEPNAGERLITHSEDDDSYKVITWFTLYNNTWFEYKYLDHIDKWCYLDDLLPKKGGSDV